MPISKGKLVSLIVAPSITGFISSFASMTLIVSILRSSLKLSTVYHRLVFFLSAFDIIQSICQLLSSLPMPEGSMWGAFGNSVTCDIQGFFVTAGFCTTVLHSLSLTIYFLLVVKFEMTEAKIKKYAEPFLHGFPVLYSFGAAIYMYAANDFNTAGTFCWIAPEPLNCELDPEVECSSSGNSATLRWIGAGAPCYGVFIGNCTILAVIWWTYWRQSRKNQAYGNLLAQSPRSHPQVMHGQDEETGTQSKIGLCCTFCPTKKCPITSCCSKARLKPPRRESVLAAYLSRPSRNTVRRLEEISNRAAAYVIAYLLSFIFTMIYRTLEIYGSGPVPFPIIFLARFFFPLQGFFNVLVYTYPHVTSYRKNHTKSKWYQAFWNVIKSGGDDDQSRSTGRRSNRRESLRKKQRVLEQSQFRRRSEVEDNIGST